MPHSARPQASSSSVYDHRSEPTAARDEPALPLLGADVQVPCIDGIARRYIDLDAAASTPALEAVAGAVAEFLPWYSSVHRGTGFKSTVSTAAFEGARGAIGEFVGARDDDVVIFVRNTTEAINLLSHALDPSTRVISTRFEHHANMLPWRRHDVELLPFTDSPSGLLAALRDRLRARDERPQLVAISGASNVTGEAPPLGTIVELAHEFDAEIAVDAAQLAPHRPIDMASLGVDYLALSGHKLYAPFGAGALIGRRPRLEHCQPMLCGGGAVVAVTDSDVVWGEPPSLHEAGSPNTVGVVALGVAAQVIHGHLAEGDGVRREQRLTARLCAGLDGVSGIHRLTMWPDGSCEHVGVASFIADDYPDRLLSTILAAEFGIAVRSGRFCAHPLVSHLLGFTDDEALRLSRRIAQDDRSGVRGAVRASISVGTAASDIDTFIAALAQVMSEGPRGEYVSDPQHNEYAIAEDRRTWPTLPVQIAVK